MISKGDMDEYVYVWVHARFVNYECYDLI